MPTTTTFPNGQILTSSALTHREFFTLFQGLTCAILGIATTDPRFNTAVRQTRQNDGAPAYAITDDVVFIQSREEDDDYNKVRDELTTFLNSTTAQKAIEYTRVWKVLYRIKGPNSFDNARLIRSAIQSEWALNTLAQSNVYLVPRIPNSVRSPELIEGQWWQQIDLAVEFNEQINETLTVPTVATIPVAVQTASDETILVIS